MKLPVGVAFGSALGVVVGAGSVVLFGQLFMSNQSKASVVALPVEPQTPKEARVERPVSDVGSLVSRISRLERSQAQTAEEPPAETKDAPAPTPRDPEARATHARQVRAEQEAAFAAEAPDPSWSQRTSDVLTQDLNTAAEASGYRVSSVECRTSRCKATLRWPSYEKMGDKWMALMTQSYSVNCATVFTAPRPSAVGDEYDSNIHFDCTEVRAEEFSGR
jgi:hypothetical protein